MRPGDDAGLQRAAGRRGALDAALAGRQDGRTGLRGINRPCHGWRAATKNKIKPSGTGVAKQDRGRIGRVSATIHPKRPVIGLDETSHKLRDTPRDNMPLELGQSLRRGYEYKRHGGANRFLGIEPLRGWCKVRVTERRSRRDVAEQMLLRLDDDYPEGEGVRLVVGNVHTHGLGALSEAFAPEEAHCVAARFEWHNTPEPGSWLHSAERERSVLAAQCLDRRIPDRAVLSREVSIWTERRNRACRKVVWHFTTADAWIKLGRLYPIIKEQNLT